MAENSVQHQSDDVAAYRVYKRRWYILATCSLLNFSNGMYWLTFAAIPNETAEFYHISLRQVDWFSITYFIVGFVFGFVGIIVIDDVGLRFAIILGAVFNAIGAILRYLSSLEFILTSSLLDFHHYGYAVAIFGQVLCACSQPFLVFSSTKLAAFWFSSKERTKATMVCSMAYPVGYAVFFLISPHVIADSNLHETIPRLLLATAIPACVGCSMALCGFCSSRPPTPPAPSAEHKTEPFYKGITKVLQNRTFLALTVTWGSSVGVATAMLSLIPQMLCPFGYPEHDSGVWVSMTIFSGLLGSVISSSVADRTKRFDEILKVLFASSIVILIWFVQMSTVHNQSILVAISLCLWGLLSLSQMPISLELGVEVTYPIAEATSTGLIRITSQLSGFVMTLIAQSLETDLPPHLLTHSQCKIRKSYPNGTHHMVQATAPKDFTYSNIFFISAGTLGFIGLVVFFHPKTHRYHSEQRDTERQSLLLEK